MASDAERNNASGIGGGGAAAASAGTGVQIRGSSLGSQDEDELHNQLLEWVEDQKNRNKYPVAYLVEEEADKLKEGIEAGRLVGKGGLVPGRGQLATKEDAAMYIRLCLSGEARDRTDRAGLLAVRLVDSFLRCYDPHILTVETCKKEAVKCVELAFESLRETNYDAQVTEYGENFGEKVHAPVPWMKSKKGAWEILPELMKITHSTGEVGNNSPLDTLKGVYSRFPTATAQLKPVTLVTGVSCAGKTRTVYEFAKTTGIPLVIKLAEIGPQAVWKLLKSKICECDKRDMEKRDYARMMLRRCILAHFKWAELIAQVLNEKKDQLHAVARVVRESVEDVWRRVLLLAFRNGFCAMNVAELFQSEKESVHDVDLDKGKESITDLFKEATNQGQQQFVLCFDEAQVLASNEFRILDKVKENREDEKYTSLFSAFLEEIKPLSERAFVVLSGTGVKMSLLSADAISPIQFKAVRLPLKTTFGTEEVRNVLSGYLKEAVVDSLKDTIPKLCGRPGIVGTFLYEYILNIVSFREITDANKEKCLESVGEAYKDRIKVFLGLSGSFEDETTPKDLILGFAYRYLLGETSALMKSPTTSTLFEDALCQGIFHLGGSEDEDYRFDKEPLVTDIIVSLARSTYRDNMLRIKCKTVLGVFGDEESGKGALAEDSFTMHCVFRYWELREKFKTDFVPAEQVLEGLTACGLPKKYEKYTMNLSDNAKNVKEKGAEYYKVLKEHPHAIIHSMETDAASEDHAFFLFLADDEQQYEIPSEERRDGMTTCPGSSATGASGHSWSVVPGGAKDQGAVLAESVAKIDIQEKPRRVLAICQTKNTSSGTLKDALASLNQLNHYPGPRNFNKRTQFQHFLRENPEFCNPVRILAFAREFDPHLLTYVKAMNEKLPYQPLILLHLSLESLGHKIGHTSPVSKVGLPNNKWLICLFPASDALKGVTDDHPYNSIKVRKFSHREAQKLRSKLSQNQRA